jgi:hypothetical protein
MVIFRRVSSATLTGLLTLAAAPSCFGDIVNGGFETGNLTGWSRTFSFSGSPCDNLFHASTGGLGCLNLPGPFDGNYAAYSSVSVQGAGSNAQNDLTQTFVLPSTAVSSATLSWNQ